MQVNYTLSALETLVSLLDFIESKNTAGAALRWFNRFEMHLQSAFINPASIKLCNNATFQILELRCIYFNDWVIAFSIQADYLLIEALLHKSRITD